MPRPPATPTLDTALRGIIQTAAAIATSGRQLRRDPVEVGPALAAMAASTARLTAAVADARARYSTPTQ